MSPAGFLELLHWDFLSIQPEPEPESCKMPLHGKTDWQRHFAEICNSRILI